MGAKRSEGGDERNTSFQLPGPMRAATPAGYHPDEEPSDVSEAQDRFLQHRPRRGKREDIPQESLAERIRKDRQAG
jgi:hypothetical protein